MPTVHARALKRAVEILGGVDQLSARLDVPIYDLRLWMRSERTPPLTVFLRAVDIISEHDIASLCERGATDDLLRAAAPENSGNLPVPPPDATPPERT